MHIRPGLQLFRKPEFYYCPPLFLCYVQWVQNAGKPTKERAFYIPAAQG